MNKKTLTVLGIVAAGFAVFAVVIFLSTALKKDPNTSIELAPDGAKLLLDGTKEIRPGKLYLEPGKHTVKASFEGFTVDSQMFSVPTDGTITVTLLLNPLTPAAYDYLEAHPKEELHREALGGQQFNAEIKKANKKNPLVGSLPFIDRLFRIDYGTSPTRPQDSDAVAIFITYYVPEAKQDALEWIKFKDVDPATLEIVYVDGSLPVGD